MDVQLCVHLEVEESGRIHWWADSPMLPGFSALADNLMDLRSRARIALVDMADLDGWELGDVTEVLVETLVSTGTAVQARVDAEAPIPASPGLPGRYVVAA